MVSENGLAASIPKRLAVRVGHSPCVGLMAIQGPLIALGTKTPSNDARVPCQVNTQFYD